MPAFFEFPEAPARRTERIEDVRSRVVDMLSSLDSINLDLLKELIDEWNYM